MPDVDLTDMRLFLTVVEHGSLTHGAQVMNLALASASERVSGMESALGARLLERTRRGVRTTAARVAEGRADLGVVVADVADLTALQTRLVAQDQLVVVASKTPRIGGQQSVTFADIVGEPFVGVSDAALEIRLGERASRLGRQIHYRVQLRSTESVGMLVEAGVEIAILHEVSAAELRRPCLMILPVLEPWALRQLHLCAHDFSALTPHATLLAKQLVESKVAPLT